jgi:two-component system, OmpR family, alkaline phosphatase synthesis response regulator PhoP
MAQDVILVVEDDLAVRRGVADALRWAGYEPLLAGDGALGQRLALEAPVRLVLLDLVLPRRQGLDVLQAIRAARPGLPVILLTALGGEDDRVRGLSLGADDYVVKPFSVRELLARVESVLRRSAERTVGPAALAVPGGEVDLRREEVRWEDGSRAPLTALEASLLRYLASCPGRLLAREELLRRVWQVDPRKVRTRSLDMTVARLRKKLRDEGEPPRVLLTVRGRGYRLAS